VKALALRDMGLVDGPLVAHFHGYDVSSYVRHFGHLTYRHLFREGDAFLAVSERMRARLIALGADAARVHVQRYPVDTRRLQPVPSSRPEDGPVKLLSVARLVEKKGLAYAIRGVARAVACGADVEYGIIGGGPLADDLKALTGQLGMSERITFHGALPHAEVLAAMRRCDVLVVPSVTATNGDEEGSPVTIIEAMALGLPVLSTWHSGIPETVHDTVTGLLVPEADDLALSNALLKLVREPALRARLGAAGRKAAEATLDRTHLYDQLERRYEALVAGGR
jgi:colanic acid/amylovoran biosynthesis glycosyltransferase